MKRGVVVLMTAAMALWFACSRDKDEPKPEPEKTKTTQTTAEPSLEKLVIGKWTAKRLISDQGAQEIPGGQDKYMEITPDGAINFVNEGKVDMSGTWKMVGPDRIEMTVNGDPETMTVKISGDLLTITNPQRNETIELKRLP